MWVQKTAYENVAKGIGEKVFNSVYFKQGEAFSNIAHSMLRDSWRENTHVN